MLARTSPQIEAATLLRRYGSDAYGMAWKALEGAVGQPNREYWAKVCELILIRLEDHSGQPQRN